MPHTLNNENNFIIDEMYNFRDEHLKDYWVKNRNISVLTAAK